jgi:hypothetical protein
MPYNELKAKAKRAPNVLRGSMSPKIIEDRLMNRSRTLRTRWHSEGERLLKAHQFVEFADGLLRLMRQLDAISEAVALLPMRAAIGSVGAFDTAHSSSFNSRANRPSRRPAGTAS